MRHFGKNQGTFQKGTVCVWYELKRAYFGKFRAIRRLNPLNSLQTG